MSGLLLIPQLHFFPACDTDTASAAISHFHRLLSSLLFSSPFISSQRVNNTHVMLHAGWALTFVVHVGGHLHHTEAQVDWQVIEMVVGLQEELSTQLYVIAHLVHLIDQHSVEVLILWDGVNMVRVNWSLQRGEVIFCIIQNCNSNVDINT